MKILCVLNIAFLPSRQICERSPSNNSSTNIKKVIFISMMSSSNPHNMCATAIARYSLNKTVTLIRISLLLAANKARLVFPILSWLESLNLLWDLFIWSLLIVQPLNAYDIMSMIMTSFICHIAYICIVLNSYFCFRSSCHIFNFYYIVYKVFRVIPYGEEIFLYCWLLSSLFTYIYNIIWKVCIE